MLAKPEVVTTNRTPVWPLMLIGFAMLATVAWSSFLFWVLFRLMLVLFGD